jgi:hypothetical protein
VADASAWHSQPLPVAGFLFAIEMTLQFGVNIPFAKHLNQPLCSSLRFLCVCCASVVNCFRQRPIRGACQTNQTFGMRCKLLWGNGAFSGLRMLRHA